VDAFLAIASKRDVRQYDDRPIREDIVMRILDAGRLAGSAVNRQNWTFVVVEDPDVKERVAQAVYAAQNVQGAALVIAVTGAGLSRFDAARASQNMMLAAWNEGVASCPNGLGDAEAARTALGLSGDEEVAIVLSFGYPARPVDPESRSAEEWSARANRKSLDEVVRRI
jgi:nitroreductase